MPPYHYAYQRIVEDLVKKIDSGELRPGDKLPSGRQLCEQYGVSTMVVRTAIMILKERGMVESASGVGVFVKES